MDITALVSTAVSIVGGWLAKTGGRIASRVGEQIAAGVNAELDEKVDELYGAIRERVLGRDLGNRAVDAIERDPESDGARVGLESLLAQEAAADEDFAAALRDLVAAAQSAGAREVLAGSSQTIEGDVHQRGSGRSTQIAQASGPVEIKHGD